MRPGISRVVNTSLHVSKIFFFWFFLHFFEGKISRKLKKKIQSKVSIESTILERKKK